MKSMVTKPDAKAVLCLNSGSSSLKFGVYEVNRDNAVLLINGQAEAIGESYSRFFVEDLRGKSVATVADTQGEIPDQAAALSSIVALFECGDMPRPTIIAHRVVHGGPKLLRHTPIDDYVMRELDLAIPFAPLHLPVAINAIRVAQSLFSAAEQVACFDTVFHSTLPPISKTLPLPASLLGEGVHRYGFHGISCESILRQLENNVPSRIIIAHLGNGSSITAVQDGQSASRSGDLDPGVLIYLLRSGKVDLDELEDLVDRRSGLIGVSEMSGDLRSLRKVAYDNPRAALSIAMFCLSVSKQISAMMVVLGGLDLLVFTGGIGEHDAVTRSAICAGLACLGIVLDEKRNRAVTFLADSAVTSHEVQEIGGGGSRCSVRAMHSDENRGIALHAWNMQNSK